VLALARRFRSLTHIMDNSFRLTGAQGPGGAISQSPFLFPAAPSSADSGDDGGRIGTGKPGKTTVFAGVRQDSKPHSTMGGCLVWHRVKLLGGESTSFRAARRRLRW
jgi:hypothetical protein